MGVGGGVKGVLREMGELYSESGRRPDMVGEWGVGWGDDSFAGLPAAALRTLAV